MAKGIIKKQNVTFYEEDEQLWNELCRLSKAEKRPVQNYILNLLYQVIDVPVDSNNNEAPPQQETINETPSNPDREKLKNLIKSRA